VFGFYEGFFMKIQKISLVQKPTYIRSSDVEDIYTLFLQCEQTSENCFFLESLGEEGRLSRYSILGFDPEYIVSGNGNSITVNETSCTVANPYQTLRQLIPQDRISRNYAGGLVGYLGYNSMNFFEPTITIKPHPLFDQFLFGIYTDGVIFDKITGELTYFYYNENRHNRILDMLKTKISNKKISISKLYQTTTEREHKQMVERVRGEIVAGNTFQTVIGIQQEFTLKGDAIGLYTRLRKINPSPFMYYLKFGRQKIIGASPELLFGMRDSEMATFPLAGTIKRGRTDKEDMLLAKKLLGDSKEVAEHTMLVDLHRNDIGKVARFGSVKVRSLMDIKKFSHVQHISSEIVGLLKPGEDMFSALASNFPAGTLTGAPKIEAIKIIERLEKKPRGPYGGAVGHFGFNGDCTFAIPIRTMFLSDSYGFTQAGSGIVADSKAENEYMEIQQKLRAIKEVILV